MASHGKLFTFKAAEDFDKFLASKSVRLQITPKFDENLTYFYFRTTVHRITEKFEWRNFGPASFRMPFYEPAEIQCSMVLPIFQLDEENIQELKEFVTREFHLNEERFRIGPDECLH